MVSATLLCIVTLALASELNAATVPGAKFGQFQVGSSPASSPFCLTANKLSNGMPVTIEKCFQQDPQFTTWLSPEGGSSTGTGIPSPIQIEDGFCLDVTNGKAVSGTKLQVWKCGQGNPNQQWSINSDSTIKLVGKNLCLDLTDGKQVAGQPVQIWTCGKGNPNQVWRPDGFGSFEPGIEPGDLVKFTKESSSPPPSIPLGCIAPNGTTRGSPVTFQACVDNVLNQDWRVFNGGGVISISTGPLGSAGLCLDVTNGVNANGTPLQMWSCNAGNPNQQWRVNAGGTIEWVSKNKCVDLTGGKAIVGNKLQIWDCSLTNPNQDWRTAEPT